MKLIFKVKAAGEDGKSPVEIVLGKHKMTALDTDHILSTLDKLLKKNKIEIKEAKTFKLEVNPKAGLTSQRIIKTIIKALSLYPDVHRD